jgi:hypothetical protein
MKPAAILRELAIALDTLHVAIDHATLDHTTQAGKDNGATRANALQLNDATHYACGLLEEARCAVHAHATPEDKRALARLERRLREITLNYLPAYLNDLGEHNVHTIN